MKPPTAYTLPTNISECLSCFAGPGRVPSSTLPTAWMHSYLSHWMRRMMRGGRIRRLFLPKALSHPGTRSRNHDRIRRIVICGVRQED